MAELSGGRTHGHVGGQPTGSSGAGCSTRAVPPGSRAGPSSRRRRSPRSTARRPGGRRRGSAAADRRARGAAAHPAAGRARRGARGPVGRPGRHHGLRPRGRPTAVALPADDRAAVVAGAGAARAPGRVRRAGAPGLPRRRPPPGAGIGRPTVRDGARSRTATSARGDVLPEGAVLRRRAPGGTTGVSCCTCCHRADVLDADGAARIAGYHLTALAAMAADPDAEHATAEPALPRGAPPPAGGLRRAAPRPAGPPVPRAVRGAGGRPPGPGGRGARRRRRGPTGSSTTRANRLGRALLRAGTDAARASSRW